MGWQTRSGHRWHPRSWCQTPHTGQIQDVSIQQELFLLPSHHCYNLLSLLACPGPRPGCVSASLLGTTNGTDIPVMKREQSFGNAAGLEAAETSEIPPIPFPCPSCLWQGRARNEKVTGQIFMKAISSTPDLPRKTSTTLWPNPTANSGHPYPYLAPGGKALHTSGNVPVSHKLQSGLLALIL